MGFSFSEADIDRIGDVLGVEPSIDDKLVSFTLNHDESGRQLTIEVLLDLALPDKLASEEPHNLVSVYATNSFLQLQGCTGYIASKELGEVIFIARQGGRTSGLVIEREAGCSLYANVNERLLSTAFQQLPPEMIMSSVALSMAETLFNDLQ